MNNLNRPIMNEGDSVILEKYNTHTEISDREELADYVRALARMVVAASREDSYHMNDVLKFVGVANDLDDGEYSVSEIHDWLDDANISEGIEAP